MGASSREVARRPLRVRADYLTRSAVVVLFGALLAPPLGAQVEESATLRGTILRGGLPFPGALVTLHHLAGEEVGAVDSVQAGVLGDFRFDLPSLPGPGSIFLASSRHDDVVYFGPAINAVIQLDSAYTIMAYDSTLAPMEGADMALNNRTLFFEQVAAGVWTATDFFEVHNQRERTVVAREGGRTWSHPLPSEATDVRAGDGDLSFDQASHEGDDLVIRAALPPGERVFVVRYTVPSPFIDVPTPDSIASVDVLFREPGPPVEVPGFDALGPTEVEEGSTYLRYSALAYGDQAFTINEAEEPTQLPLEGIAVMLALMLTAAGLYAMRGNMGAPEPAGSVPSRELLLTRIAQLDEEFAARATPTDAQRLRYEKRRAQLIGQVRSRR